MKYINTILIVDDDPSARYILEGLLLREGYHLEFACGGQEALEKAQILIPSLILLDVMMPEMDGFEVCRKLRAIPLLAEVPIIIITSLEDRGSRLEGIQAGADDFLSKPFDREELRARVRTIMRLNRHRRLHVERAKFEWVIQHTPDGYIIINSNDEILYANPHACHFLNLSEEQFSSQTPGSGPSASDQFLSLIRRQYVLEPQDSWASWPKPSSTLRYLVRPETPMSEAFWLQVDILELPSESGGEKVIHLYDVTTQMNVHRNRWGFQTMMCHKLRTPLVAILGSLEFLTSHAEKLSPSDIAEFAKMSLISARRLHSEIEDILQYMTASGTMNKELPCHVSKLPSIIQQIGKDVTVKTITINITEELHDALLPFSRRVVELIFYEILENSIKFHPDHSPEVQVLLSHSQVQEIKIRIEDNGMTLSPKQLTQMWIPYYQGGKYLTGEESGMGLGLAMVAVLVWGIGGSCQSYNQEDQSGIIIELRLPLTRQQ